MLVEVEVAFISYDVKINMPIVVLREKVGTPKRLLPIWISRPEATAIYLKLHDQQFPRPMTHDLMKNILDGVGAEVMSVAVHDLVEVDTALTFMGRITLQVGEKLMDIDSRPSDAIALALRAEAPILVAEKVIQESGFSEEALTEMEKQSRKSFLESMDEETLGEYKV